MLCITSTWLSVTPVHLCNSSIMLYREFLEFLGTPIRWATWGKLTKVTWHCFSVMLQHWKIELFLWISVPDGSGHDDAGSGTGDRFVASGDDEDLEDRSGSGSGDWTEDDTQGPPRRPHYPGHPTRKPFKPYGGSSGTQRPSGSDLDFVDSSNPKYNVNNPTRTNEKDSGAQGMSSCTLLVVLAVWAVIKMAL